jgi:hypothetical protein
MCAVAVGEWVSICESWHVCARREGSSRKRVWDLDVSKSVFLLMKIRLRVIKQCCKKSKLVSIFFVSLSVSASLAMLFVRVVYFIFCFFNRLPLVQSANAKAHAVPAVRVPKGTSGITEICAKRQTLVATVNS